jgi:hypothetical protein
MHTRTGGLRLRSADLHWREIDGEVVALDARELTYVAANSAGALLWQALAEGATRDGLAQKLVSAYGIARERALADVDAFIGELISQGLLEA